MFTAFQIFFGGQLDAVLPMGYYDTNTGAKDMNTTEHKQAAAAAGIEWSDVLAAYREARALEAAELERITTDRRQAFSASCGDSHGGHWKARNRAALTGGDATYVKGLDVTAADRGMSADDMYDMLSADAPTMRPADDVMRETIERLADMAGQPDDEVIEWVPLVAAAAAADITEQWARQLVKAGKIRGRRDGRRWMVAAGDLAFFQRHPTAGRPRLRAHLEASPF